MKTPHVHSMPVALALLVMGLSVFAAEPKQTPEQSRAELERKLEDAQERLDVAAREVAELSMSLSDGVIAHRGFHHLSVNRAVLGIVLASRDSGGDEGVQIESVSPGGGAAQAGLKPGDVILEMDGERLAREGDRSAHDKLLALMRDVEPNEKVKLRYRRDGKVQDAQVEAQPLHDRLFTMTMPAVAAHPIPGPLPHMAFFRAAGVFGSAELVPMTPKLGQYFGTDTGLLVVRAPQDGRLKLEEGDVILDIDGRTPSSPSHALRILSSYQGGEKLRLSIMRAKKKQSFEITVPEGAGEDPFEHHFAPDAAMGPGARFEMPLPPPGPATRRMMKEDAV
jgi:hypothetical protein